MTTTSGTRIGPPPPGPGWIVFSALAVLGLIDSVAMLATDTMGFAFGLGWNKAIVAGFRGLALSSSPSSGVLFTLASSAAQLGVIGLLVFFAYLARHRSLSGYVVGVIVYGLGALLALWNGDLATASVHLVAVVGLVTGLAAVRGEVRRAQESDDHDPSNIPESGERKRLRKVTVSALLGCGGLLITTTALIVAGFVGGSLLVESGAYYGEMEQRILQRAPADLTPAEREQLHEAMAELARLESRGEINLALEPDIRRALTIAVVGEGERASRDQVLDLIRLIAKASEREGRRSNQDDDALHE